MDTETIPAVVNLEFGPTLPRSASRPHRDNCTCDLGGGVLVTDLLSTDGPVDPLFLQRFVHRPTRPNRTGRTPQ